MNREARTVTLRTERVRVVVDLDDSTTADAVLEALPLQAVAHRWGDEIYFDVPFEVAPAADARQDMAVGELAYWPVGPALCLFFGPTPVSTGTQPRAYSPVNPCGRMRGDATVLAGVREGDILTLTLGGDGD